MRFYLTDATYRIRNGKAELWLFGRNPKSGGRVLVIDRSFEPYFHLIPKKPGVKAAIMSLGAGSGDETYEIVRVEEARMNLNETPVTVLRAYADIPKGVPELARAVRALPDVQDTYEYDIPFVRRYLIDRELYPMTAIDAEVASRRMEDIQDGIETYEAKGLKDAGEAYLQPRVLALDIETACPAAGLPQPHQHAVLMVGLAGSDGFRRVLTWKEFKGRDEHVEVLASEDAMLQRLAGLVKEYGPDFLATYNGDGFDLPFLAQRARKLGIPLDLGADGSGIESRNGESRITGLCHLDVYQFVKHVVGRSLETDSFTLDAVSHELLGERKHAFDYRDINAVWAKGDLRDLCRYNLRDAELTLMLADRLLPNVTELVRVTGIIPYDSIRMAFSQHVENYLLRRAHAAQELAPNKPRGGESEERSMKRAVGAFVLEPTPGFYERIAVFDFRSLYPSIIASHNISPGVMDCSCCKGLKNAVPGFERWFCTKRRGFLSGVIEDLIRLRAEVKKQLKQKKGDPLLQARSEALKVLANSFYGYLGFPMARWYCFECLESVTAFGRDYIHQVIEKAKAAEFQVLYGDTDSIFLLLGKKTVDQAKAFAAYVNEELPGMMELDFEGHYPAGLFVAVKGREAGAKKRYALIDESGRLKIRGFETVRRNTSAVARELQHRVLELLLKGKTADAVAEVRNAVAALREHTLPLTSVVITTMLQKQTSAYAVKGPHVAAAERLAAQGIEVGPGTLINFIVATGKGKISGRVLLPEEAKQADYDADYYIENQVIPAVERIFATVGVSQEDLLGGTGKVAKQQTLAGF